MFTRDSVIISYNIKTPLTSISRAVGNILQLTFNAPCNLTVEFKMTNCLELNWELDGVVDEQRYYFSETPFTSTTLPTPKAVLLNTDRTYVDTDIDEDKLYYVAVSSVRNGVEKVSAIKEASTTSYLLNMPFSSDKNDRGKFNLVATTVGSAVIQDGYLYVPAGSYLTFNTAGLTELNLGTADFEFGIEVALMSEEGGEYPCLFGVGAEWSSGAISMQFNPQSRFMCAIRSPEEIDAFAPTNQIRDGITFAKYIVRRVAGVWTTYKDGVAGTSLANSAFLSDFTRNGVITIGAAIWSIAITASHCKIKNLYLRKL